MPLISILIPTFNRGYILSECFTHLKTLATQFPEKFEILVSNNNSSDNTLLICEEWKKEFSNLVNFECFNNSKNIGVSKNIISLFEKANGRYSLLLGDDDKIITSTFGRVITSLEDKLNPSALIQGFWPHSPKIISYGFCDYKAASSLFYEYGNSWAGIIDSQAAKEVLQIHSIRAIAEEIVWPQTLVGFIAIYNLKYRPIFITDFQVGESIYGSQNITNKDYWVKSLLGLLKCAVQIDLFCSTNWIKKTFLSCKCIGFLSHLKAIISFSIISSNTSSSSVRDILKKNFGLHGYLYSAFFYLLDFHSNKLKYIYVFLYSIKTFSSFNGALKKIDLLREKYNKEVAIKSASNYRDISDWF